MLNPALYPAIFARKSIRQYDENNPLSQEQLELIRREIAQVQPLLPDEKFQLELASSKEGWRIYGYCENTARSNVNLGFVMQQLDLTLYLQGLGRLWYGFGREPRESNPPQGLSYAMCLKVGNPAQGLAREPSEFDRKAMSEVSADPVLQTLLEAARLAPSAMNSQPWRFTREGGSIGVCCKNPGVKKLFLGRMNQIDMGICLCHTLLALEHAGYEIKGIAGPAKTDVPGFYGLLTIETNME